MEFLLLLSLFIFTGLLLSFIFSIFYSTVWTPLRLQRCLKKQGFAGPPYKVLTGNLKDFAYASEQAQAKPMSLSHHIVQRVAPYQDHIIKTYGKMSMFWFGLVPRIQITDPELIREVLYNKLGEFQKIKADFLTNSLVKGLVSYEGEKWSRHRRLINPAFHLEKIKDMFQTIWVSCDEVMSRWEQLVSPKGSHELDVWPELQSLTVDLISRSAFGSNYQEGNQIFKLQTEQSVLLLQGYLAIKFPGYRFLPTKSNLRRKEIVREVKSILKNMIQKREKAIELGESQPDDLLGLLLESNLRDILENGSGGGYAGMTIDDVIEECKLFYFAGQESTSILLTWTMVLLSMHKEWQTRAREEVQKIFGKNKQDFDGLNQLKTMTMVFYEVLRLYPPVVNLLRATYKDIKLGNATLPAGVQLLLPIIFVHRDPELWGTDAEEFKPERFAGGISKATKNPSAFFPFGGGPRICIAQNFALVEAKLAMAMILQRFWFELSPSYAHAPYTLHTLQPQFGAQIILHSLESN